MTARLGFTVDEAAEMIGVSPATAWKLIASAELDSVKIGARRIVPLWAIEKLLTPATPEPVDDQPDWPPAPRNAAAPGSRPRATGTTKHNNDRDQRSPRRPFGGAA